MRFVLELYGLVALICVGVIVLGLLAARVQLWFTDRRKPSLHEQIVKGWEHYGKNRSDLGERRKLW